MSDELAAMILVVDDERATREALREMARSLGYRVSVAAGGAEALQLAASDPPDAVLLDVRLPGTSGLDVCRQLRASPRTAMTPILLVTGRAELEDRLAGFRAGADDFIAKPFNLEELAARLRSRLELATSRAELARARGALATLRMVAHEFNNPLQELVGGLHMLREARTGGEIDEEEALGMISEATEELAGLARRVAVIAEPSFKPSPFGPMLDVDASR